MDIKTAPTLNTFNSKYVKKKIKSVLVSIAGTKRAKKRLHKKKTERPN